VDLWIARNLRGTTPQFSKGPAPVPDAACEDGVRFRCSECFEGYPQWMPCLQHLRTTGHCEDKTFAGTKAQDIRRLMELCLETAKLPPPEICALSLRADEECGTGGFFIPVEGGLRVTSMRVDPCTLASDSGDGLQAGDVITAIDGRTLVRWIIMEPSSVVSITAFFKDLKYFSVSDPRFNVV